MRRNSTGSTPHTSGPLIAADELTARIGEPDVRVLDMRWYLGDPDGGRRAYEAGHIPGAVFIDLDQDITGSKGAGRHPLPTREQFERAMRNAGVNRGDRVVAYDDAGGSVAARLWWLLRIFGHPQASVLDGGIQAWLGKLETNVSIPRTGDFIAQEPDLSSVVSFEQVAELPSDSVLMDVRAPERFRGDSEPVDPIAGHIPGAENAFWQETVMDEDGKLASPQELRKRFEILGVRDANTVVHCGSGVVACQTVLALERAGFKGVRIYTGGWSDWANRDGVPVATGED